MKELISNIIRLQTNRMWLHVNDRFIDEIKEEVDTTIVEPVAREMGSSKLFILMRLAESTYDNF